MCPTHFDDAEILRAQLIYELLPGSDEETKNAKLQQFLRSLNRILKGQPVAKAKLEELEQFFANLANKCTSRAGSSGGCTTLEL